VERPSVAVVIADGRERGAYVIGREPRVGRQELVDGLPGSQLVQDRLNGHSRGAYPPWTRLLAHGVATTSGNLPEACAVGCMKVAPEGVEPLG
jgi:chemotaxis regulatin CheY-phosphate phosphatase CheZ